MRAIVLSFVFCGIALGADPRTYEIKQYPKDSGDCHQVARDLGVKFQQVTGAEVLSAICRLITAKGYDLVVTYQPVGEMPLVSTFSNDSLLDERGGFKTEKECRMALPGEVTHFTQSTGLTPVVSYCTFEEFDRDYPWGQRIDAFGETKVHPHRAGVYLFGQILGWSLQTFTDTLVTNLHAQGIDARWARLRSSIGYGRLSVFYYGERKMFFDDVTVTKLRKKEQCQAVMSDLDTVLAAHGPRPAMTFCSAESIGGYFELVTLFPYGRTLNFNPSAEAYKTYELCQEDRERLILFYQEQLLRPVIGGYCGIDDREYRVTLLETK